MAQYATDSPYYRRPVTGLSLNQENKVYELFSPQRSVVSLLPETFTQWLLHKRSRAAEGDHPSRKQADSHIGVQIFTCEVEGLPERLIEPKTEKVLDLVNWSQ